MLFFFLPHPIICSLILSLNSFLAQCLMWPYCPYLMTSLFSSCKAQWGSGSIHLGRHCSSHIRAVLSSSFPFISLLFECMWYECVSSSVSFPWGFFNSIINYFTFFVAVTWLRRKIDWVKKSVGMIQIILMLLELEIKPRRCVDGRCFGICKREVPAESLCVRWLCEYYGSLTSYFISLILLCHFSI